MNEEVKMKRLMKTVKLIAGLTFLFSIFSPTAIFSQDFLRSNDYGKIPATLTPSEWKTPQQEVSKVNRIIEYEGTTVIIDGIEIGRITEEKFSLEVFYKEGPQFVSIGKDGTVYVRIDEKGNYVQLPGNLYIKGDQEGKVNYIKAETERGSYAVEKDSNNIKITFPFSADTFTMDTEKFISCSVYGGEDGEWVGIIFSTKDETRDFLLTFRHEKMAALFLMPPHSGGIYLDQEKGVNLNLIPNEDDSVTVKSNVENSIALKVNSDGSTAIQKYRSSLIPMEKNAKIACFNKDGSLTIRFKNETSLTEKPTRPIERLRILLSELGSSFKKIFLDKANP